MITIVGLKPKQWHIASFRNNCRFLSVINICIVIGSAFSLSLSRAMNQFGAYLICLFPKNKIYFSTNLHFFVIYIDKKMFFLYNSIKGQTLKII